MEYINYSIHPEFLLLFARIILGLVMVHYGLPKILDLTAHAEEVSEMGFKPGMFWGILVASLEFFGGIAILFGIFVDFFAALYAFMCLTATLWALKKELEFHDYSYNIILLALAVIIMAWGPGLWALSGPAEFYVLRWDIVIVALVAASFLAFMPEILGKKYRHWKF